VLGGASEAIFGKVVGGSLTVEGAGPLVVSSRVFIAEGAGILVVSSPVGIAEGAGIRFGCKLDLSFEGSSNFDEPSREGLMAVFSRGSSSISSSGRFEP
jgi:hypothetical protein